MSFFRHKSRGVKYAGAKARCVSGIAPIINSLLKPGEIFWDCFCGSAKITTAVRRDGRRYATDIDPHIILLLKSIQRGWNPPTEVTEEEYKHWRDMMKEGCHDPMVGFVGYSCSFGGKFFGGYARGRPTESYPREGRRALLRQKPFLEGVKFVTQGYSTGFPGGGAKPDLIYCDPPYTGTISVGSARDTFDHKAFWKWAVERSEEGTVVLVSEYACPVKEAHVLWERTGSGAGGLRSKNKEPRVERLFCLNQNVRAKVGLGLF